MTPDELDSLWDFDDPDGSEQRFRALLPGAGQVQGGALLTELLTQIARAEGLEGRFRDADRTLDDAEAALLPSDERGRVANTARREGRGSSLFLAAWDRARAAGEDALAVDAAHMLGIVEPSEEAWAWNERAMELARRSPEPAARRWVASFANNMGWARHDACAYDEALELFQLALAERRREGGRPRCASPAGASPGASARSDRSRRRSPSRRRCSRSSMSSIRPTATSTRRSASVCSPLPDRTRPRPRSRERSSSIVVARCL